MYLWRRRAGQEWSNRNEKNLRIVGGDGLAIIEQPDHKQVQFQLASNQRAQLEKIARKFGGQVERLPSDWLKSALRRKTKPIKVGSRRLKIPGGAAFGTGEHATTAMSLKLLECVMRFWGAPAPRTRAIAPSRSRTFSGNRLRRGAAIGTRGHVRPPELVVDLGTGSGILAMAAKILGATRVIGIDNDPVAISTARQNARLNKIRRVSFRVGDVRNWKLPRQVDIVTANLFSGLLVETLPRLRAARRLILSGILRAQERDVRRVLTRNKIEILEVRRRGKWVAILTARS